MFLHILQPVLQVCHIKVGHLRDILVPYSIRERFTIQTVSVTFRALHISKELVSPFLATVAFVVLHYILQVFHYTIKLHKVVAGGVDLFLVNFHSFERTIHNLAHRLLRNILNRSLQVTFIFLQDGLNLPENHLVLVFSKRNDSTCVNACLVIRNHLLQVDFADYSQTLTVRAGTLRRVEREHVWSRILVGDTRSRVHQALRESLGLTRILLHNHQHTVALFHGSLYTVAQSLIILALYGKFINHHLDIMILVAVHLHTSHDFLHLAIHTDVEIALTTHTLEELTIVTLTLSHEWSQNIDALLVVIVEDHLDYLLLSVFHHRLTAQIAVGSTRTCVEQTQIIVDFGSSTHRRTRVLIGRLLFNADHRRKTSNLVNIRTFHIAQEVAGISRESLDIAALTLGENSVEGKR